MITSVLSDLWHPPVKPRYERCSHERGSLIGGLIAGVVAISVWEILRYSLRRFMNYRHLSRLAGRYRITLKYPGEPVFDTASVEVHNNVLTVVFEGLRKGESVTGKVVMDERFPVVGRGLYEHKRPNRPGWGFWDVQVGDSGALLVQHTFSYRENELITQGYVWERLSSLSQ